MALTYSTSPTLGFTCPDFQLTSVDGQTVGLGSFSAAKLLVVMFICNHCPYVKAIEDRLITLGRDYGPNDVAFVAICSNDSADYPEDTPAKLLERRREKKYPFPYLVDETQDVAKQFGAVCTPDIYLFDKRRCLGYRGRLDDSWKNPAHVKKRELKAAIDQLLAGETPGSEQVPSMGCSIKWKND